MPTPRADRSSDDAIREQAYYLWEKDGKPSGRDNEYWQRALAASAEKPKRAKALAAAADPEKPSAAKATKSKAAGKPDKVASKAEKPAKSLAAKPEKASAIKAKPVKTKKT